MKLAGTLLLTATLISVAIPAHAAKTANTWFGSADCSAQQHTSASVAGLPDGATELIGKIIGIETPYRAKALVYTYYGGKTSTDPADSYICQVLGDFQSPNRPNPGIRIVKNQYSYYNNYTLTYATAVPYTDPAGAGTGVGGGVIYCQKGVNLTSAQWAAILAHVCLQKAYNIHGACWVAYPFGPAFFDLFGLSNNAGVPCETALHATGQSITVCSNGTLSNGTCHSSV